MNSEMMTSEALDRQIDVVVDNALRRLETGGDDWVPACNVWDDEKGFYVQLAVPGWQPDEISLDLENQRLMVKGERVTQDTGRYYIKEIGGSGFMRVFRLPAFVDHEKAKAIHSNGLLTISFPKREEARTRRILIEAA